MPTRRKPRSLDDRAAAQAVAALRACRAELIRLVLVRLHPGSPVEIRASHAVTAINALADEIAGRDGHFCTQSYASPEALAVEHAWLRWERGDGPKPK